MSSRNYSHRSRFSPYSRHEYGGRPRSVPRQVNVPQRMQNMSQHRFRSTLRDTRDCKQDRQDQTYRPRPIYNRPPHKCEHTPRAQHVGGARITPKSTEQEHTTSLKEVMDVLNTICEAMSDIRRRLTCMESRMTEIDTAQRGNTPRNSPILSPSES